MIYFFSLHTIIRRKCIILFHLFFLLCTTIRPKIRVHTDSFLYLCTTIRPKIRVLIDLLFSFAHDHSTKVGCHSNSLIYSFLNSANIWFAVLPLYFVCYIRTLIFRALYSRCSYISYTMSMAI